jgi:hypothetical protein
MTKYIYSLFFSHLIAWGVPMISVFILSFSNPEIFADVGPSFCWIRARFVMERFFLYYIWIFICWIFNLTMLILVTLKIFRTRYLTNVKLLSNISGRVALYGAIFVFCWIIGFTIRTIEIFYPNFNSSFLGSIHLFLINSISFYIAIIFIYCENVIEEYRLFCNCNRETNQHLNVVKIPGYNEENFETMMLFPRRLSTR